MTEKSDIRIEIEKAIPGGVDQRIEAELDLMDITEGVEGKNNLQLFYEIWQKRKGQNFTDNKINSWTAYALGFASEPEIDSEFMPPRRIFARSGFPDIDTDFDDERRDGVYEYIIEKYGREFVGNIGTFGTLKMKSAINRVTKAVDAAYAFHKGDKDCKAENHRLALDITATLPVAPTGVIKWRDEGGEEVIIKTISQANRYIPEFRAYMDEYPNILRHATRMEGVVSNNSVHAAGVVISDIPLSQIAPLRTSKKGLATQFPYEDLESIGLIKFDILALAALTVIRDAINMVEANYGIKIDIENLPLDDEPTLALYRTGKLRGVFQCENGGMQETMREIGVDNFRDVMAAIALYRPGPMDSIPEYVARKKGYQDVDYFHPTIEPFVKEYLEPTYGVLVYQEQVMQIVNSLAGFTITDGYIMIKAVGKKKLYLMKKFADQFVRGCVANKVPENIARQYWDKFIIPFSDYGFNAAHSACYGYVSYQTAYLKANYTDEFFCSFLNVFMRRAMRKGAQNWDQVDIMERDAQRNFGIEITGRDLDKNGDEFQIIQKRDPSSGISKTKIMPPVCCKGVGEEAAKNIAKNRPYQKFESFVEKTDTKCVTTDTVAGLCEAGFFGPKGKKNASEIIERFGMLRDDLKKSRSKGIREVDIFA